MSYYCGQKCTILPPRRQTARSAHLEHDLADVEVLSHAPVSLLRLLNGIDGVDHGADGAGFELRPELLHEAALDLDLLFRRAAAQRRADHAQARLTSVFLFSYWRV